ncbi:MAG: thiamine pyrophosphate-binding protein [Chloroflexi bacterium]|nr:thiamine pyrophosphate-binding protein [Chloroflexota bacterium]
MVTRQETQLHPSASAGLAAKSVLDVLDARGVTHLIWLPDSESAALFVEVQTAGRPTLIQVCREGEAFGVAAGLIAGGKKPVVLIQSTGLFESGDSLRGLALWLRLPLPLLVGYRGWDASGQSRDSAAWFLEPVLTAWKIPYRLVTGEEDLDALDQVMREASAQHCTLAALITTEWV